MRHKWLSRTSDYIEAAVLRHNLMHTATGFRQGELSYCQMLCMTGIRRRFFEFLLVDRL
jgi:hypothetical protein